MKMLSIALANALTLLAQPAAAQMSAMDPAAHAVEASAPVEAVGVFRYRAPQPGRVFSASEAQRRILELIRRRPATLPDLALALQQPEAEVGKLLDGLFAAGKVGIQKQQRGNFYLPSPEETE
ncbi:MAG: hypothetical protein IJJ28_00745 [Lentisphaeria bacterium]|nr:hypothetical protein [Lentisphaeria bacterium]